MSSTPNASNVVHGAVASLPRVKRRRVSARALDTRGTTGIRTILLEMRIENPADDLALSASEAAELMFELGYALEEAARIASGRPPRDPA